MVSCVKTVKRFALTQKYEKYGIAAGNIFINFYLLVRIGSIRLELLFR